MNRELFWASYGKSGGEKSPREFARLVGYKQHISIFEEDRRKPDQLRLNVDLLRRAFSSTWGQIAYDMERNAKVGGFRLTNIVAIETCWDCDNLIANSGYRNEEEGRIASNILRKALKQFEYSHILQYLSDHIKLV